MVMARIKPIQRSRFEDLYPFTSRYMEINGLDYHYLDEGRGEPIVMVHGNPTWSFYFRNLVAAFRDRYRVIVPDHIGCGLSAKPSLREYDFRLASRVDDLTTLVDRLIPGQPLTLVLHDWGGIIGLAWAMGHTDQVKRLVITNTSGFFPPRRQKIPRRLRIIRTPNPLFNWAVLRLNLFARAALVLAARKPLSRKVKEGLLAPYNCPRHRLATLKFVQDIPLTPQDPSGAIVERVDRNLATICSCPTLILWGAHDFVFTRSYYDEWCRRLPQVQCHWLKDAGHYLFEDQPQKIIDLINDFLRSTPGR
jgi:pimeloyl-ACP methyl ester carboxylesterase